MTNPLQQLLALTQGGQPMSPGMAATGPSDMTSETPDIVAQLQALMGGGGGSGGQAPMAPAPGGNPMSQAIQAQVGPPGSMGPGDQRLLNNETPDEDYARHGGVNDWPGQRNMGAYLNANDPGPVIGSEYGPANVGRDRIPGQQNMGAYLNGSKEGPGDPKYDQTKAELDDVSKRMGGNPEEDGNFPSQSEIDALNAGKIDPVDFDKKWGKGAAAEMQDVGQGNDEDDANHAKGIYGRKGRGEPLQGNELDDDD